jgi:hypothetical protein
LIFNFFLGLNKYFTRVPQEDLTDGQRAVYQLNVKNEDELLNPKKRKMEEIVSTSSKKLKLE